MQRGAWYCFSFHDKHFQFMLLQQELSFPAAASLDLCVKHPFSHWDFYPWYSLNQSSRSSVGVFNSHYLGCWTLNNTTWMKKKYDLSATSSPCKHISVRKLYPRRTSWAGKYRAILIFYRLRRGLLPQIILNSSSVGLLRRSIFNAVASVEWCRNIYGHGV